MTRRQQKPRPIAATSMRLDPHLYARAQEMARRLGRTVTDHISRGIELANDEALEELRAVQRARIVAADKRARRLRGGS